MQIHKEGRHFVAITFLLLFLINTFVFKWMGYQSIFFILTLISSCIFGFFIAFFFRLPKYSMQEATNNEVVSPASGKIVAIEEVNESEYFKDKRIQVSIFMSPANIHVNWSPISGIVKYAKYHPGNYLVAWHPKSSTQNERYTTVIENEDFGVLVRQIAGKVARKIENYVDEGQDIISGMELGFIKFGSRVDLFLPLNSTIEIKLNQKVNVGKTIIATFNK